MMAEVYYDQMANVMRYYGTEEAPLADFPFNFNLINDFKNRSDLSGFSLKKSIDRWLDNLPEGKWPNWVVSIGILSASREITAIIVQNLGQEALIKLFIRCKWCIERNEE